MVSLFPSYHHDVDSAILSLPPAPTSNLVLLCESLLNGVSAQEWALLRQQGNLQRSLTHSSRFRGADFDGVKLGGGVERQPRHPLCD